MRRDVVDVDALVGGARGEEDLLAALLAGRGRRGRGEGEASDGGGVGVEEEGVGEGDLVRGFRAFGGGGGLLLVVLGWGSSGRSGRGGGGDGDTVKNAVVGAGDDLDVYRGSVVHFEWGLRCAGVRAGARSLGWCWCLHFLC